MENNFSQPGILKRLECLIRGHKILYDGHIKKKKAPTLQDIIYDETETHFKTVGMCFCPRCYSFVGIHYTEEKPKKKPLLQDTKSFTNKKKKK